MKFRTASEAEILCGHKISYHHAIVRMEILQNSTFAVTAARNFVASASRLRCAKNSMPSQTSIKSIARILEI